MAPSGVRLRPAEQVVLRVRGQLIERAALLLQRGARRAAGREQCAVSLELEQLGAHHGLVRVRNRARVRNAKVRVRVRLGASVRVRARARVGHRLGLHAAHREALLGTLGEVYLEAVGGGTLTHARLDRLQQRARPTLGWW